MRGNSIISLSEIPSPDIIECLKTNATKYAGVKSPRIYHGKRDGCWMTVWVTEDPPDWLLDAKECV